MSPVSVISTASDASFGSTVTQNNIGISDGKLNPTGELLTSIQSFLESSISVRYIRDFSRWTTTQLLLADNVITGLICIRTLSHMYEWKMADYVGLRYLQAFRDKIWKKHTLALLMCMCKSEPPL